MGGSGLAWLPGGQVRVRLERGGLQSVRDDWCATFDGYYAYYPSGREVSVAVRTGVDGLRGRMGWTTRRRRRRRDTLSRLPSNFLSPSRPLQRKSF